MPNRYLNRNANRNPNKRRCLSSEVPCPLAPKMVYRRLAINAFPPLLPKQAYRRLAINPCLPPPLPKQKYRRLVNPAPSKYNPPAPYRLPNASISCPWLTPNAILPSPRLTCPSTPVIRYRRLPNMRNLFSAHV